MQMDEWEMIVKEDYQGSRTERLEVPGGWIYRTIRYFHVSGEGFSRVSGCTTQLIFIEENHG